MKATAKKLDLPIAGQPATALVIGYDRRAGRGEGHAVALRHAHADPGQPARTRRSRCSRSRATCAPRSSARAGSTYVDKINAAYANCGSRGTLDTVRKLNGVAGQLSDHRQLPRLHAGRRQARRDLDGRRPPLLQHHSGPTGYATINLQPGYQKLNGYQALDFVRFRHTDSDLYRNARQQLFVRALKDQVRTSFSLTKLPKVIKVLTSNIEVAQGGGHDVSAKTVLSYAVLAYSLPPGHVFQSRIEGLEGFSDLTTSPDNISAAIRAVGES